MVWILFLILIVGIICLVKKQWNVKWQSIFVVSGFLMSCVACVVTYLRIEVYTTNDTFIGVLASFIGVCTTIIVGLQIYNSIDTRNKIQSIENECQIKFASLESMHKQLEIELKKSRQEREKSKVEIKRSICRAKAISLTEIQPFTAFISFVQSLHCSLELDDANLISLAIKDLQALNGRIEKKISDSAIMDISHSEKIKEIKLDNFNQYHSFPLITSAIAEILHKNNKLIEDYKERLP